MPNFRDGTLETGQAFQALSKTVLLTADNQAVTVGLETMLLIGSDNTTATNRTFTLTPSTVGAGHVLRIEFNTGSSTTAQLADSGTMKLNGDWLPVQYDTLTLQSDGTNWVEVARSYTGQTSTISLASAHLLVGNASNVAADVALSGDATIDNAGALTIANLAVTNAKVSASAAIAFSKLGALASGNIIVGSAGTVPTSVAMAGDVTIIAAGTTTIGAAKVTEAMQKTQQLAGLHSARVAHGIFDATAGKTQTAFDLGATIPINAFITGAWYWVKTTFTSSTDAATIALSVEGGNDVVSAIAISNGGNPWDTTSKPVEGIPVVETTSTWLKTTAARAVTATVAVENLTAGVMHVWVQYVVFE